MNKKIIPMVVVIFLVLLAVGVVFASKNKGGQVAPGNSTEETASAPQSLKDIIAANVPQKCTFSAVAENGGYEGVVYSSGGKFRGDFTSTSGTETTTSHMIIDGTTNYTWTDGQTTGYKMTVESEEAVKPEVSATSPAAVADLNQKADYKCAVWVPDDSLFELPKDITFTDLSALTQPGAVSDQCAACNYLTGDSKTQCLTALKCQ